jgi:hypothetical protein
MTHWMECVYYAIGKLYTYLFFKSLTIQVLEGNKDADPVWLQFFFKKRKTNICLDEQAKR